jgi:hypothetical protein
MALFSFFLVSSCVQPMKGDEQVPFEIPTVGCPMAHADRNMSDNCFLPVPKQNVGIVWHSLKLPGEKAGSVGLGFSGNGYIAACTYEGVKDNLVIYDYDGNILWSSGFLLDSFTATSAPMVDIHNRVIACDNKKIVLVDPLDYDHDGVILEWESPLPYKGLVLSPILLNDSTIVLATKNGPLYAFNSSNGHLISYTYLQTYDKDDPLIIQLLTRFHGFYETINTPCVQGNRVYVLAQFTTGGIVSLCKRFGSLIAVDIVPNAPDEKERMKIAWHYDFGGPSGGSPLLINDTIYFDSEKASPHSWTKPYAHAIIDKGDRYEIKWVKRIPCIVYGSFAKDPRNSFWIIDNAGSKLHRTSVESGDILEYIDVDGIVNEPGKHIPCTVITICENEIRPILILGVNAIYSHFFSAYVIAIDLTNNNSLLWKVKVASGNISMLDFPSGQFPVLIKENASRIVFSTLQGAWAIGEQQ